MLKRSKLEIIYGEEVAQKVLDSKLLVVGAGGIGCELIKCLSMTGFKKLSVIDLDTIDISNLNRQFLFRREHVDKPKSETLKETICKQNPGIEIEANIGRIQEDRFGFTYFHDLDLVINALDNLEARNHVNMLCFNLGVPLVEAGTNGYKASCVSICRGQTQCYQCMPQVKEQSFPVCTIRQKPDKIIHCIVWSKALYEGLYGSKDQGSSNIIEDIIEELNEARKSADKSHFAEVLFDRVFFKEPNNLLETQGERLKNSEQPVGAEEAKETQSFLDKVHPLTFKDFKQKIECDRGDEGYLLNSLPSLGHNQDASLGTLKLQDYVFLFCKTLIRIEEERKDQIGSLSFDKDDELAMDFVTAATNLRAHNFTIKPESLFKIKEMAGKIMPAISSSNALVAALQVFEGIKLLAKRYDQLRGISYKRLCKETRLCPLKRVNEAPSPTCAVCSDDSRYIALLTVKNFDTFTFKELVDTVLPEGLKVKPESLLIEFGGNIIFEREEDLDEDEVALYNKRLSKPLTELKFKPFSIIYVQCTFEGETGESDLYVQLLSEGEEGEKCEKEWSTKLIKKGVKAPKTAGSTQNDDEPLAGSKIPTLKKVENEENGLVVIEDDEVTEDFEIPRVGQKRPSDAITTEIKEFEAPEKKRQKVD